MRISFPFVIVVVGSILLFTPSVSAAADVFDPAKDPDLFCSACEIFVSEFQSNAASKIKKEWATSKKTSKLTKIMENICDNIDMDTIAGDVGQRKFMNFMKAQNGGEMSFNNLSMGPDVKTKFEDYCNYLSKTFGNDAVNAVANAPRVYDAKLRKEVCVESANACKKKGKEL